MLPTDQIRRRNAGHILCVGPKDLFTEAVQTAGLLGLSLVYVNSFDRAQTELWVRSYEAVIVALESNVVGDALFDDCVVVHGGGTEMRYSSRFLQHCVSKYPSMFRIVWSNEALDQPKLRKACFDCGADAVKATQGGLFETLFAILTPPTSTQLKQRDILTKYAPVHHRAMREEQLLTLSSGTVTKRLERLIRKTERLEEQVLAMSPLLVRARIQSADPTNNKAHDWALATAAVHNKRARLSIALQELKQAGNESRMMRVVHVSDTVGQHRTLSATLPGGNLFVHSGNFTDGNPANAEEQLQDFLVWLETVVCPRFDQVVFIAGRNETLLDKVNCPNSALCLHAKLVLEDYLQRMPNAAYLENSSIMFEGYRIYGCPTVYDRNATTRMSSSSRKRTGLIMMDDNNDNVQPPRGAFERPFPGTLDSDDDDDACNGNIDILVTNRPLAQDGSYELPVAPCLLPIAQPLLCPPQKGRGGGGGSKRHYPMLEKFARRKQKRQEQPTRRNPALHVFGYNCKGFGIAVTECDTVQMNSCQTRNLRFDKNGGGTPLVVDLPTYK